MVNGEKQRYLRDTDYNIFEMINRLKLNFKKKKSVISLPNGMERKRPFRLYLDPCHSPANVCDLALQASGKWFRHR